MHCCVSHVRILVLAGGLAGCDAADPDALDVEADPSRGKADGADASDVNDAQAPGIDVVFVDGLRVDAQAHWTPNPDAPFQLLTWSLVVHEGQRMQSSETLATTIVGAGRHSLEQTLARDYFDVLGAAGDSMGELRSLELQVRVEPCTDSSCAAPRGPATTVARTLSFLVRPYPRADLRRCCGPSPVGSIDDEALAELSEAVARTQCQNVLITMGGTLGEGQAGSGPAEHFMRDRGYDCLVSVAYHDRDWGWGSYSSDDTILFCQSTRLGVDALERAWEAAVVAPDIEHWDMFGYSKGAAAISGFYQRRWSDVNDWPWARLYTVGMPWRMGVEHLPTPGDYRPGQIYGQEQIVGFTWSDDFVQHVDGCFDTDALSIRGTHDYTPMFAPSVDDDPQRASFRDAFMDGVEVWVGEHY